MIKLIHHRRVTPTLKTFTWVLLAFAIAYTGTAFAKSIKPAWYRYYDHQGVANLSTSVSPNHIRYGYEALDRNMQVIQRTRAFNSEKASSHNTKASAYSKQREADQRLKQAYGSSRVASQKRQENLTHLSKQIKLQQHQIHQLQKDRLVFKKQELQYTQKGRPVPLTLQHTLNYNQQYIQNGQKQLQSLKMQYQKNQAEYDRIITRLKALE